MITSIRLHPIQKEHLRKVDLRKLQEKVLTQFPYPLAISFKNLIDAAIHGNKLKIISTFAYDVSTSVFQFLALVQASEYYQIKGDGNIEVYKTIEDMIYRPGPGKWHAFLKEYNKFLKKNPDKKAFCSELTDFTEKHSGQKKGGAFTIEENHGQAPDKKAGLLDLMIQFRNSLAHSRAYHDKDLNVLSDVILTINSFLFSELSFLAKYKMLVTTPDPTNPVALTGAILPSLAELNVNEYLVLEKGGNSLKLFPLLISDRPARWRPEDIFLLESIDNDRVFFSGNRLMSEKLKGRDEIADKLYDFLQSIYEEPPVLDLENTSWKQFRSRSFDYSQQVVSDYVLNNKYNDLVYVYPEEHKILMDKFFISDKKITFLADRQGSGKSALCAHLTNEIINVQNSEEAVILIDARLLDEIEDHQDVFKEFIKKKLGLKGDLLSFLQHTEKEVANFRFTVILDNLNEYFRKELDQSFLLEQIIDFTYQFSSLDGLKIITIARPEYFQKSFERYAQSFKDLAQDLAFMPNDTAATGLPVLTDIETRNVWENFKKNYIGYSPKTSWEELNGSVKENCRTPLILLFLLKQYDNKEVPPDLSVKKIKNQYIRRVLKDKELKKTLFDLVKKMHQERRPYLLTDSFTPAEIARLSDSSNDNKYGLPKNHGYVRLLDMQILREEKIKNEDKTGKKISVNNEMTMDIINSEYKKTGLRNLIKQGIFMQLLILLTALLVVPIILIFFIIQPDISDGLRYELRIQEINLVPNFEKTDLQELIQAYININYPNRLVLIKLGLIVLTMVLFFMTIFLVYFIVPIFFHLLTKNEIERKFSFYDILQYKIQNQLIYKKFIQIARPSVFVFVIMVIWVFYKTPAYKSIDNQLISYTIYFILFLSSVVIYLTAASFINQRISEKFVLYSFYHREYYTLFFSSLSVMILILLFLANFKSIFEYQFNRSDIYYKEKNADHILQIQSVENPENIQIFLKKIITESCEDKYLDRACKKVKYLANQITKNKEEIPLDVSKLSFLVEDFIKEGGNLLENVWQIILKVFVGLQLFMVAMVQIPVFIAKILKDTPPKIKVI